MPEDDTAPKTGTERIISYFNDALSKNHPVAIKEIEESTGLSWSFVKKTLAKLRDEYDGFHFEKSGSTWIAWKDRDHIIKKLDDTCSRYLVSTDDECDED